MFSYRHNKNVYLLLAAVGFACAVTLRLPYHVEAPEKVMEQQNTLSRYLVQGLPLDKMVNLVTEQGGRVTHYLPVVNAIGAVLTQTQYQNLSKTPALVATPDRQVRSHSVSNGSFDIYPDYVVSSSLSEKTGAAAIHTAGVTGQGIGVAVLDSGISAKFEKGSYLRINGQGALRNIVKYDAIKGQLVRDLDDDHNGHGSHIAGVIASSAKNRTGELKGIAPDVSLISVRVINKQGEGDYLDVIRGIGWVIENKDTFNIRVLNLSFGAQAEPQYWQDPLNQAVMRAWNAGLVVVTSAGNLGPQAGNITAPGNVPDVITVGAYSDNNTPFNLADDGVTSFSSHGPTSDNQVKPDLVSWGGQALGKSTLPLTSVNLKQLDRIEQGTSHLLVSGTSQAAAVISGTAALMLQRSPELTPEQVKCRLMASANPRLDQHGHRVYSENVEGAGLSNAFNAVFSPLAQCQSILSDDIAHPSNSMQLTMNSDLTAGQNQLAKGEPGK